LTLARSERAQDILTHASFLNNYLFKKRNGE